jgi:hypothetical protein
VGASDPHPQVAATNIPATSNGKRVMRPIYEAPPAQIQRDPYGSSEPARS